MDPDLSARLLASIEGRRLVVFWGAGLSMAAPSNVASARTLSRNAAAAYTRITGNPVPAVVADELDAFADFLLDRGMFYSLFFSELVDWSPFRYPANDGHLALADFLAAELIQAGISTNVDTLIEQGAQQVGIGDFQVALDGAEMMDHYQHAPYLKLHGCIDRERRATVWSRSQLQGGTHHNNTIATRLSLSGTWLRANLLNRDLVFIGFWSDWKYLNEILVNLISPTAPNLVVLVAPDDPADLQRKAPQLWTWSATKNEFRHARQSGAEFLTELRVAYSKRFLARCLEDALQAFSAGNPGVPAPGFDFGSTDPGELYALRRDLTGSPPNGAVRHGRVQPAFRNAAALHLRLRASGAVYSDGAYQRGGSKIRVFNGANRSMSDIRAEFFASGINDRDLKVVCTDSYEAGTHSSIIGRHTTATVTRKGSSAEIMTVTDAEAKGVV